VGDEARRERLARNEVSYRSVNEAIQTGRKDADGGHDAPRPYMCECGLLECNELVELTVAEYEEVRANPRRFFMVDGHELPEVEHVVDRRGRYTIAEKNNGEGRIAEENDPRSPG
jgi:hypothetical protein